MTRRGEVTEDAWNVIALLLPAKGRRGGQWRDVRSGRSSSWPSTRRPTRVVVERSINRLKQWRSLATRYEKRAANYRAMVVLASITLWLSPRCPSHTLNRA